MRKMENDQKKLYHISFTYKMVFPYEYGNMFHRKMSSYKQIEYELYAVGLMGPTSLCVYQFEEGGWQGLLVEREQLEAKQSAPLDYLSPWFNNINI